MKLIIMTYNFLRKVLRHVEAGTQQTLGYPRFSFFLEKKWSRPVLLDWFFNFDVGVDLGELHSCCFVRKSSFKRGNPNTQLRNARCFI